MEIDRKSFFSSYLTKGSFFGYLIILFFLQINLVFAVPSLGSRIYDFFNDFNNNAFVGTLILLTFILIFSIYHSLLKRPLKDDRLRNVVSGIFAFFTVVFFFIDASGDSLSLRSSEKIISFTNGFIGLILILLVFGSLIRFLYNFKKSKNTFFSNVLFNLSIFVFLSFILENSVIQMFSSNEAFSYIIMLLQILKYYFLIMLFNFGGIKKISSLSKKASEKQISQLEESYKNIIDSLEKVNKEVYNFHSYLEKNRDNIDLLVVKRSLSALANHFKAILNVHFSSFFAVFNRLLKEFSMAYQKFSDKEAKLKEIEVFLEKYASFLINLSSVQSEDELFNGWNSFIISYNGFNQTVLSELKVNFNLLKNIDNEVKELKKREEKIKKEKKDIGSKNFDNVNNEVNSSSNFNSMNDDKNSFKSLYENQNIRALENEYMYLYRNLNNLRNKLEKFNIFFNGSKTAVVEKDVLLKSIPEISLLMNFFESKKSLMNEELLVNFRNLQSFFNRLSNIPSYNREAFLNLSDFIINIFYPFVAKYMNQLKDKINVE